MARDFPIIFSAPMVLALLEGRKTQTRRLARDKSGKPTIWSKVLLALRAQREATEKLKGVRVGDRLWVRENWRPIGDALLSETTDVADFMFMASATKEELAVLKWRPSIHMPRWASRLTLVVTAIKVEPLQNISEKDAIREGLINKADHTFPIWTAGDGFSEHFEFPRNAFRELWERLHGTESWDSNPEVVALTFEVHKGNIDALGR